MRRLAFVSLAVLLFAAVAVQGYIEVPYSLGRICHEAKQIVLVEVTRIDKQKNLIIYKKLKDIKGKFADEEIKHNIGTRGYHPRESQTVMTWADVGKKAVFFTDGNSLSLTCVGQYWYKCYRESAWWGLTHAEPYLLRTYCGDVEKLADAVTAMLEGKEVIVPCMVDGNKEQLHERRGKLQRLKASLKLLDYNAKRDFFALGGDGENIPEATTAIPKAKTAIPEAKTAILKAKTAVPEAKTAMLLAESSAGWKFTPATPALTANAQWRASDFDDSGWRRGQTPIGYGEAEIAKRAGTTVTERGQPFLFRRQIDVPAELLRLKGVTFRLCVASDDSAVVYLNGTPVDEDPVANHEFSYWNRDVELKPDQFRAGRNVIAVLVKNRQGSSDLYFDLELSILVPVLKADKK